MTTPCKSSAITFTASLMGTALQLRLGWQVDTPRLQLPQFPEELSRKLFQFKSVVLKKVCAYSKLFLWRFTSPLLHFDSLQVVYLQIMTNWIPTRAFHAKAHYQHHAQLLSGRTSGVLWLTRSLMNSNWRLDSLKNAATDVVKGQTTDCFANEWKVSGLMRASDPKTLFFHSPFYFMFNFGPFPLSAQHLGAVIHSLERIPYTCIGAKMLFY